MNDPRDLFGGRAGRVSTPFNTRPGAGSGEPLRAARPAAAPASDVDLGAQRRRPPAAPPPEDDALGDEIQLAGRLDRRPRGRLHRPLEEPPPAYEPEAYEAGEGAHEPDGYHGRRPFADRVAPEPRHAGAAPAAAAPTRLTGTRFEPQPPPPEFEAPPIQAGRTVWPPRERGGRPSVEPSEFIDPRAETGAAKPRPGRSIWPADEPTIAQGVTWSQRRGSGAAVDPAELVLDQDAGPRQQPAYQAPRPAARPRPQVRPGGRFAKWQGRRRRWPVLVLAMLMLGAVAAWALAPSSLTGLASPAAVSSLTGAVERLKTEAQAGAAALGLASPPPALETPEPPAIVEQRPLEPAAPPAAISKTRFWDQAQPAAAPAATPPAAVIEPVVAEPAVAEVPLPPPPKPRPAERSIQPASSGTVDLAQRSGAAPAEPEPSVLNRLWAYLDHLTQ